MQRRAGFTIIALLVVITIIGLLMSIGMASYGVIIGGVRERATRTTLSKIQSLIDSRAQAFNRRYIKSYSVTSSPERILTGQSLSGSAADIAAMKLLEAKWFPQSGTDLLDTGITINGRIVMRQMSSLYPNFVTPTGYKTVTNPELFYDFLTQEASLGNPTGRVDFDAREVNDHDLNGLPCFIDGWGNPIRFYRWPTRLFRPQGQTAGGVAPILTKADLTNAMLVISSLPGNIPMADGATDLGRDPDDPLRTLWAATQPIGLENMTFPGTSITGPTPSTWWTFMAVSAGPDGVLGLYEPDDNANFGNLAAVKDPQALSDDIVSFSMKTGGK